MKIPMNLRTTLLTLLLIGASVAAMTHAQDRVPSSDETAAVDRTDPEVKKYLYVAVPGLRRYLEHGGHGLLVFDIEDDYRFVKRIPTKGLLKKDTPDLHGGVTPAGQPSNVKGIDVSLATNSVYISNLETMQRVDLEMEEVVWEKEYEGGADRMSISSDGKTVWLPSLEKEHWHVVDAETGEVIETVFSGNSGAHNTIFGP
ncbi:MAG: hypothetical protein WD205_11950, partial [Rhodothermales bacterium]